MAAPVTQASGVVSLARVIAIILMLALTGGAVGFLSMLLKPVYWHLQANYFKPYKADPLDSLLSKLDELEPQIASDDVELVAEALAERQRLVDELEEQTDSEEAQAQESEGNLQAEGHVQEKEAEPQEAEPFVYPNPATGDKKEINILAEVEEKRQRDEEAGRKAAEEAAAAEPTAQSQPQPTEEATRAPGGGISLPGLAAQRASERKLIRANINKDLPLTLTKAKTAPDPVFTTEARRPHTPLRKIAQVDHGLQMGPMERRQPQEVDGEIRPEDYGLTKERMDAIADEDGYIMVTWANFHYLDFVLNWVEHVEAVIGRGGPFVVGAMDQAILEELVKRGIHTFDMASGLTTGDFGWGTKTFHKMGRKKIALTQKFTEMGLQIVLSDVDTVWMRNPLDYFKQYPEADILTSSDGLRATVEDESLERYPEQGAAANIGIMLFRPSSREFCKRWVDLIEADENIWDQNAFNQLYRVGAGSTRGSEVNLFKADHERLTMGILPVSIFCSGHTYFASHMPEMMGLQPYVVHATFQYSGTVGKRNRMRERLLWNDEPDYFRHEVGWISYVNDVPQELVENAASSGSTAMDGVQGHFKLVNHQLLQLRHAFAIAGALRRGLVLPEFWAGNDRWWAPHGGTIPGSATRLPLTVPADHILDLENGMTRRWNEQEAGPHLDWREYSFLDNPRLPSDILENQVVIEICDGDDCNDGSSPAGLEEGTNRIKMKPNLTDEQIRTALSGVSDRPLLQFTTMLGAFGDWQEAADKERFMRRTVQFTSLYCCIHAHPGHIWYDMWWDTPGHHDRHNRLWDGEWEPKTGP